MELIKFMEQYPTEEKCRTHFKELRMWEGIICKRCHGTDHYWLQGKEQFQCVSCKFRTTLRSGTVMENSNLSFKIWYSAMYFMTSTKKGISASEMQRQLGMKRYEPVWALMHKVRKMMGKRDALYKLNDMIEFDEGHFTHQTNKSEKKRTKPGKGSATHTNVAVMAESFPVEEMEDVEQGKENVKKQCRYFKMQVLDDYKSDEINQVVQDSIHKESILFTDNSRSYVDMEHFIEAQIIENSSPVSSKTHLKWVHIIIANAKRTFVGVYHKMKKKYLQNYLDEFVYKLNRRFMFRKLFERALIAAVFSFGYNCG